MSKIRLCRKTQIIFVALTAIFCSCLNADITVRATRNFSSVSYLPGQTMDVTLSIGISGTPLPTAVIIEETVPETWRISSANIPYDNFIAPSTYKWLDYNTTGVSYSIVIKYTLSIPGDAAGVQYFTGKIKYMDNEEMKSIDIGGSTYIEPPTTAFEISPTALHFGTIDTSANVVLGNLGGSAFSWTSSVTTNDGITGWIRVPGTGTLNPGETSTITVQIVRSLLNEGSHTGIITFSTNTTPSITKNLIISAIVGSPSPIKEFIAGSLGGFPGNGRILLIWKNPENFTGTIIFHKTGVMDWDDIPQNGTSYAPGSRLPGGAQCVFKDSTARASSFIDTGLDLTTEYFYRIFSFDDSDAPSYYPLYSQMYLDDFSRSSAIADVWPHEGEAMFNVWHECVGTDTEFLAHLGAFYSSSGVSEPDPQVYVSYVDAKYIPPHQTVAVGFKNTYLLSSNFTLNPEDTVCVKIPVRLDDLTNIDTYLNFSNVCVYHWPGPDNKWENVTKQVIERNIDQRYMVVKMRADQLNGNDYFSLAVPLPVIHSGGGGCFIATAAYGTPFAKQVELLKKFRDQKLLTNKAGRAFVRFYYRHSPVIADFIRNKPILCAFVRGMLKPIVWLCGQFVA